MWSCGHGGALSPIVIPTSALKSTWRWDDLRDPVRHLQGALRVMPYIGGFPVHAQKCNEVMTDGFIGRVIETTERLL